MIRLLVLLFTLAAAAATAQTVPVRSGEHPTFSRLVLSLPSATQWRIGRDAEGYLLQLDRPLDFMLDGVFDRLPEARIEGLTQVEPGVLQVRPACDCHVVAFLRQDDRLVIDVTLGPPPADSPFEARLGQPAIPRTEVAILPLVTPRIRSAASPGMPDRVALPDDQADRLAVAGQALREGIARAATEGFLTPDTGPMIMPPRVTDLAVPEAAVLTAASDTPAMIALAPADAPTVPAPQPGIAVVTAPERARMDLVDQSDGHCLADSQFAVADWAGSADFAAEIGRRRAAILSSEDGLRGPAVEDLARAYLHFGFGIEAEQALAMDNLGSSDRRVLRALARLVDGSDTAPGVFSGQADCTGPVALWAALANGSVDEAGDQARIAIEAAHRDLPAQLRLNLSAPLAAAFLASGDAATADAILASIVSVADPPPLDVAMTAAEVQLVTESPQTAIATLTDIAETDDRMTAAGLVRLLELSMAAGQAPEADLLALAAAMRYEARGTAAAQSLLAAEVRANVLTGDFDRALDLMDEDSIDRADAQLRGEVAIAMATRASPTRFVEAVFDSLAGPLPPEAENSVAARLLELGFADHALSLVMPDTTGPAMAERRYLRAEAALALGRVLQAEAALVGMTDPRATGLRTAIRTAEGDFAGALAAAGAAANPELAWRAGAWDAVGAADPLIAEAAAARVEVPTDLATAPPLAGRSALLTEAAATRALAEGLLDQFADDGLAQFPDPTTGG